MQRGRLGVGLLVGLIVTASATTVSAYTRNSAPVAVSASCSVADATMTVRWSKDAGKPYLVVLDPTDNAVNYGFSIANKLMSKAAITVVLSEYFSPYSGQVIDAYVLNDFGDSNRVQATCS